MRVQRDGVRAQRDGVRVQRDGVRVQRDGVRAQRGMIYDSKKHTSFYPRTSLGEAFALSWLQFLTALTRHAKNNADYTTVIIEHREQYFSQGSLHTVTSNDHTIPLVSAPRLEKLARQTALHHTRTGHDHTWTNVLKVLHTLQGTICHHLP